MGKKKINHILCDTNILFELLKGNEKVKKQLDHIGTDRIAFCIITHAEAYCGSSKLDFTMLKNFFGNRKTYHITEDASKIFNGLIQSHYNRHSKWIPDALIASVAMSNNLELFTLNRKDFDFIPGLKLYNP
jgi:hypothetical protein